MSGSGTAVASGGAVSSGSESSQHESSSQPEAGSDISGSGAEEHGGASTSAPQYLTVAELKRRLQGAGLSFGHRATRAVLLARCQAENLVSAEEVSAPRRRPDTKAAKAKQKASRQHVVKCTLTSLMFKGHGPRQRLRSKVQEILQQCVAYCSKLAVRGSLFAGQHILRLLEGAAPGMPSDEDLESLLFWRRVLSPTHTVGTSAAATRDAINVTRASLEGTALAALNVRLQPPAPRLENLITALAETYKTSFLNNLWVPLPNRCLRYLRLVISDELGDNRIAGLTPWQAMQVLRTGTAPPPAWPPAIRAAIVEVRTRLELRPRQELTEEYAKAHPATVLRFNHWLAGWLEARGDARVPVLVPKFDVRAHHIKVDINVLAAVARAAVRQLRAAGDQDVPDVDYDPNNPPPQYVGDKASWRRHVAAALWQELFPRAARLRKGGRDNPFELTYLLTTDGTAASVHMQRQRTDADTRREQMGLGRKGKRKRGPGDRPASMQVQTVQGDWLDFQAAARPILGVDPGREVLACVAMVDSQGQVVRRQRRRRGGGQGVAAPGPLAAPRTWRLTRNTYRNQCGRAYTDAHIARQRQPLAPMQAALSQARWRTTSRNLQRQYAEAQLAHEALVWPVVLHARYRKWRFITWSRRIRTLDRFWRKVKTDVPEAVVAYGSARWAGSQRGTVVTPQKAVYASAARHLPVVLQGEWRTSQTCDVCGGQVQPAWHKMPVFRTCTGKDVEMTWLRRMTHARPEDEEGRVVKQARGLRVCPNCSGSLRARDPMAAANIARAFHCMVTGQPLPHNMQH